MAPGVVSTLWFHDNDADDRRCVEDHDRLFVAISASSDVWRAPAQVAALLQQCRAGMLLSVLLPTHNRLEYLRYAIESVRRQNDPDWEIVVSDNASTDDIRGYVESVADERVRYVRTESFVPVTENWNNALRYSEGDYVVMLGDDDALLPGYVERIRRLGERFQNPDAVYTGALLYAYPGVLPGMAKGFVEPYMHGAFFDDAKQPYVLAPEKARALAAAAANFRAEYAFNMQYVTVRREVVSRLTGSDQFFRSPFPDFYAMNLVFAAAERIVIDPTPRVVIGITRRSYGFYHFNHQEDVAVALLNNGATDPEIREQLRPILLPGTNLNTGWLLAVEALYRQLGSPQELRPNYQRYRRLQALYCEQAYHVHRVLQRAELRTAEVALSRAERVALRVIGPALGAIIRATPMRARRALGWVYDRLVGQYRRVERSGRVVGRYQTIAEVCAGVENGDDVWVRT